ncbi:UvrD-helicase domain-containing protein [Patulibacter brassicae]|uniref:UvrD-helicase domain-containing protein n=1 Tax=Patulibacter brassicae TaxID=1705717 RepID=A0ABU4VMS7_9ACTN|nr:UvrD-helicase domain-containing protein [Patulibacter brassicae]MDX8152090.1 UvrD-helicase domain-containing protein [Patulibacter brassicae]
MEAELTQEQREVVLSPASARTIVVAGPGTGKTHVIAARVRQLIDSGAIEDPERILVLSFTRAAVDVLHRRLADHSVAREVRPSTIDSYARKAVQSSGQSPAGGFDAIIRAAIRCESEDPPHEHVIVDEAQDLSGDRLSFVTKLLTAANGFTVLGDPAQGIYGWQETGPHIDAMDRIAKTFEDARRLELTEDHRTRSPAARPLDGTRSAVAAGSDEQGLIRLRQRLKTAPQLDPNALMTVLRYSRGETAVLCRTNAQVLQLSATLAAAGVAHRIQQPAQTSVPPFWLSALLRNVEADEVQKSDLDREAAQLTDAELDQAWSELERLASDGEDILLARIRSSAAEMAELPRFMRDVPVLSTVHRSKGLEFDRVIVTDLGGRGDEASTAEEARVLFVAATRARDAVLATTLDRPKHAMRRRSGRWIATPWNRDEPLGVEISVGDVDRSVPFLDDGAAGYVQRHLRTAVTPGDAVQIEPAYRDGRTDLDVVHRGVAVARLTAECVGTIGHLGLAGRRLEGLVVDRLSTAVGSAAITEAVGAGAAGLWLVPEISGFASVLS